MSTSVFEALNEEYEAAGERPLVNPRNAAAGSLRQKDPAMTAQAAAVVLGVPARRRSRAGPKFAIARGDVRVHRRRRVPGEPGDRRTFDGIDEVAEYCAFREEHRHDLGYEIDGVVIKVDDLAQRDELGLHVAGAALGDRVQVPARGAHHEAAATSRCRSAEPVGPHRSPCSSRSSSADRRCRWRPCTIRIRSRSRTSGPGDTVIVRKAGDVIPEVVGPVLSMRPDEAPSRGSSRRRVRRAATRSCVPTARRTPDASLPIARPNVTRRWPTGRAVERWTSRGSASRWSRS